MPHESVQPRPAEGARCECCGASSPVACLALSAMAIDARRASSGAFSSGIDARDAPRSTKTPCALLFTRRHSASALRPRLARSCACTRACRGNPAGQRQRCPGARSRQAAQGGMPGHPSAGRTRRRACAGLMRRCALPPRAYAGTGDERARRGACQAHGGSPLAQAPQNRVQRLQNTECCIRRPSPPPAPSARRAAHASAPRSRIPVCLWKHEMIEKKPSPLVRGTAKKEISEIQFLRVEREFFRSFFCTTYCTPFGSVCPPLYNVDVATLPVVVTGGKLVGYRLRKLPDFACPLSPVIFWSA